jgi:hypothetical protein
MIGYLKALRAYLAGDVNAIDRYRASLPKRTRPAPPGGIVTEVREDATPGEYEPPFRNTTRQGEFTDLFQGRAFGSHAQGYAPDLDYPIPRGPWHIELEAGDEFFRDTQSGTGGEHLRGLLPARVFGRIILIDQYANELAIEFFNAKERSFNIYTAQAGQTRRLYVRTLDR